MSTRGLGYADFGVGVEDGMVAADLIIKDFQTKYPDKVVSNPDLIYP